MAGGENVWNLRAKSAAGAARFGEVRFYESAMKAVEFGEWMERFDDAGALGPAATDAPGESDHSGFAVAQCCVTDLANIV